MMLFECLLVADGASFDLSMLNGIFKIVTEKNEMQTSQIETN